MSETVTSQEKTRLDEAKATVEELSSIRKQFLHLQKFPDGWVLMALEPMSNNMVDIIWTKTLEKMIEGLGFLREHSEF
jgi:hypothetical protein